MRNTLRPVRLEDDVVRLDDGDAAVVGEAGLDVDQRPLVGVQRRGRGEEQRGGEHGSARTHGGIMP